MSLYRRGHKHGSEHPRQDVLRGTWRPWLYAYCRCAFSLLRAIARGSQRTVFLVESGLALALDYNALPRLATYGGCLTPAAALGDVLLERVCRSGRITFTSEVIAARNVTHDAAM
jgi:hypothetical protein